MAGFEVFLKVFLSLLMSCFLAYPFVGYTLVKHPRAQLPRFLHRLAAARAGPGVGALDGLHPGPLRVLGGGLSEVSYISFRKNNNHEHHLK